MIEMIYTALKNDLDDGWYPRVIGLYGREDPFVVTDVDLGPGTDEEITILIGTYANGGRKQEIQFRTDSFYLDPIHRDNVRAYRLMPNRPRMEAHPASEIIKKWGERTAKGNIYEIEINIGGNETFHAHDYYWDGSGDWVVLKGHNDIRPEHYIYLPGDATVRVYTDRPDVYVVDFDQIYTH